MLKKFINSDKMSWFRKGFLNAILNKVETDKVKYCCWVWSWHKLFICWKDIKEVKEERNSLLIKSWLRGNADCGDVWFNSKQDRILFLNECLAKF